MCTKHNNLEILETHIPLFINYMKMFNTNKQQNVKQLTRKWLSILWTELWWAKPGQQRPIKHKMSITQKPIYWSWQRKNGIRTFESYTELTANQTSSLVARGFVSSWLFSFSWTVSWTFMWEKYIEIIRWSHVINIWLNME